MRNFRTIVVDVLAAVPIALWVLWQFVRHREALKELSLLSQSEAEIEGIE